MVCNYYEKEDLLIFQVSTKSRLIFSKSTPLLNHQNRDNVNSRCSKLVVTPFYLYISNARGSTGILRERLNHFYTMSHTAKFLFFNNVKEQKQKKSRRLSVNLNSASGDLQITMKFSADMIIRDVQCKLKTWHAACSSSRNTLSHEMTRRCLVALKWISATALICLVKWTSFVWLKCTKFKYNIDTETRSFFFHHIHLKVYGFNFGLWVYWLNFHGKKFGFLLFFCSL